MIERESCFDCPECWHLTCHDEERHIWIGVCWYTGKKVTTNSRMRPPFWCPWYGRNMKKIYEVQP